MKKILHVVTNVAHYEDESHLTGLWLSELAHAWEVFAESGYTQTIISPAGGAVPLEPRSLKFPNYNAAAKDWHLDPLKMALLENTLSAGDVSATDFDAIYFTGGHAVMYDFPGNTALQNLTADFWEQGKLVPYNAQQEMIERGAGYSKALLPFIPHVVVDGNLVTG